MGWTKDTKHHVVHLSELQHMMRSGPSREYPQGTGPEGFHEYWDQNLRKLYLVACLVYLEDVFGMDAHWKRSQSIKKHIGLFRTLESMRCVRNCVVHNAGKIDFEKKNKEAKIIGNFDQAVRDGEIEIDSRTMKPWYSIRDGKDTIALPLEAFDLLKNVTLAYLQVEGRLVSDNGIT